MKNIRLTVLVLLVFSTLLMSGCSVSQSSYAASKQVLLKYPNAELVEIPRWANVVEFYVRTEDGAVLTIIFSDSGKMLTPRVIFPAKR